VGLKDLFTAEGRAEARLKKNLTRVLNKHAQSIDRVKAIEALRDIGSDEAIRGLLRRFNVRYDKSIEDEQEKDYVFEILTHMGAKVLPALRKYLLEADSIAWGLKVLQQVGNTDQVWETLGALLKKIEPGYERDPTKKQQLLTYLRELKDPRTTGAVAPFLEDVDEGVRFLACEVLMRQGDESCRPPLARRFLVDESLRIKKQAAEAFVERGWTLPLDDPELPELGSAVPPDYTLDRKTGKLRRSGH
jgi:hypothetical protein